MVTKWRGRRVGGWLWRYGPSEVLGTLCAVLGAGLVLHWTGSDLAAAVAGTWAENLAYYGLIVGRAVYTHGWLSTQEAGYLARDLVLEFGPAELLDSLLVRPGALYLGMALLPTPALGVLVGKLAADILFYLPTIVSYELLQRHQRSCSKEESP